MVLLLTTELVESRLPGRQNFWQHLTVTEKRLPIFMSAIVGMQRGLSPSLLQQRLTPTLLPPRISLWISRRHHPTPFPSFPNIRKPPLQSGWLRSRATVAFVFRRFPERREGPLYLLFVFPLPAFFLLNLLSSLKEIGSQATFTGTS